MSIVAESTIGSVIAMLLQKGAKKIEAFGNKKGELEIKSVDEKGKTRETVTIPVSKTGDNFSFTEIGRATTTQTKKPETPDLEFENPRKIDSTVSSISIIPDASFKTKGIFSITVNNVELIKNKAAGDLTDVVDHLTEFFRGKKIRASQKVRVFLWTSDATSSSLAVSVSFAE